jgi:hypothetical protein
MTIPVDKKDQAIYHTILSDMHRLRAAILNVQTITDPSTEQSLREHFAREQNVLLGRLREWQLHRGDVYRQANADFQGQMRIEAPAATDHAP